MRLGNNKTSIISRPTITKPQLSHQPPPSQSHYKTPAKQPFNNKLPEKEDDNHEKLNRNKFEGFSKTGYQTESET
jgi:hypothetical protein